MFSQYFLNYNFHIILNNNASYVCQVPSIPNFFYKIKQIYILPLKEVTGYAGLSLEIILSNKLKVNCLTFLIN